MRNFGGILVVLGAFGFFYSSSEGAKYDPVPPEKSLSEALEHPAGKWEMARYACAGAAGLGFLMALFPKGR